LAILEDSRLNTVIGNEKPISTAEKFLDSPVQYAIQGHR
jgi:hypothetical protein